MSAALLRRFALLGAVLAGSFPRLALDAEPTIGWTLTRSTSHSGTSQIERGKALFQGACAVCHGVGIDRPGTSSLDVKYQGRLPALLEKRTDLTAEAVLYYIRHGIAMMPQFRKTELDDEEAAAIAAYLARPRR